MSALRRDVLVQRLLRVFQSRGGATAQRVKAFDDSPAPVKTEIVRLLAPGESPPFLVFVALTGDWTAVSLEQVLWKAAGQSNRIQLSQITAVQPLNGPRAKASMDELSLSTKAGGNVVIPFEPGAPCCGLWNMLLSMIDPDA